MRLAGSVTRATQDGATSFPPNPKSQARCASSGSAAAALAGNAAASCASSRRAAVSSVANAVLLATWRGALFASGMSVIGKGHETRVEMRLKHKSPAEAGDACAACWFRTIRRCRRPWSAGRRACAAGVPIPGAFRAGGCPGVAGLAPGRRRRRRRCGVAVLAGPRLRG
jgi:hypothetical protein